MSQRLTPFLRPPGGGPPAPPAAPSNEGPPEGAAAPPATFGEVSEEPVALKPGWLRRVFLRHAYAQRCDYLEARIAVLEIMKDRHHEMLSNMDRFLAGMAPCGRCGSYVSLGMKNIWRFFQDPKEPTRFIRSCQFCSSEVKRAGYKPVVEADVPKLHREAFEKQEAIAKKAAERAIHVVRDGDDRAMGSAGLGGTD